MGGYSLTNKRITESGASTSAVDNDTSNQFIADGSLAGDEKNYKKESVVVYEPLQKDVFEVKKLVFEQFDTARDLFYAGKFAETLPLFEAIIKEDRPAYFYAKQRERYIGCAGEWKGYWQAMSK